MFNNETPIEPMSSNGDICFDPRRILTVFTQTYNNHAKRAYAIYLTFFLSPKYTSNC